MDGEKRREEKSPARHVVVGAPATWGVKVWRRRRRILLRLGDFAAVQKFARRAVSAVESRSEVLLPSIRGHEIFFHVVQGLELTPPITAIVAFPFLFLFL
jgi:hypothetical protein